MPGKIEFLGDGFDDSITSTGTASPKPDGNVDESKRTSGHVNGIRAIDPSEFIDGGTEREPRRRGRPRRSRLETEAKTPSNLTVDLESILLNLHLTLGVFAEELVLDPKEAKQLSDSLKELGKHYTVGMDAKKLAWLQLSITCGGIYGPRGVAAYRRVTSAKPKVDPPKNAPTPIDKATKPAAVAPVRKPFNEMTPSELSAEPPINHNDM